MKRLLLLTLLVASPAFADVDNPTEWTEQDGSPSVYSPWKVAVSNGTLTDNGDGSVSLNTGGGSGSPGGSPTQVQYNNAGAFGGITGSSVSGSSVTFGSIDATRIGPSSAADATFTNVTVSGASSNIAFGNGYFLNGDTSTSLKTASAGFESIILDLESTANMASFSSDSGVNIYKFTADGASTFRIEGTSATGSTEPIIDCYHNKTAADSDDLCNNTFSGNDSAGNKTSYSLIFAEAVTVADGSETGRLLFQNRISGTMTSYFDLASTGIFNVIAPINIDSGTIDGTTIGASSAADATFSQVTVGSGAAGVDYKFLKVDGESSDLTATWDEDGSVATVKSSLANTDVVLSFGTPSTLFDPVLQILTSLGVSAFGVNGLGFGAGFVMSGTEQLDGGSTLFLGVDDGGTVGDDVMLGKLEYGGHASGATNTAAAIAAFADGAFSGTSSPGRLSFFTTPAGSLGDFYFVDVLERMTIYNDGSLVFNDLGISTADVRMESDTEANMFVLDASADTVSFGNATTVITKTGTITSTPFAGGGNRFVCVNNSGTLYVSGSACV